MSASDSFEMQHSTTAFDWILSQDKIRDGQYGPVFSALRADTGKLITVEKLDLDEPGESSTRERIAARLEDSQIHSRHPNIVSYLGCQRKEEDVFILREHSLGGTLRELTQKQGAIPQSLIRVILRQILLGLQQLQKQGTVVAFLDANNIIVDNKAGIKIEPPLLDVSITGHTLPSTILTLPEVISNQRSMRKADVWLFGIVALQLISGGDNSANRTTIEIQQARGSAWELMIPEHIKKSELGEELSDLLYKCFIVNIDERPSISDLLEHPFLTKSTA